MNQFSWRDLIKDYRERILLIKIVSLRKSKSALSFKNKLKISSEKSCFLLKSSFGITEKVLKFDKTGSSTNQVTKKLNLLCNSSHVAI